VYWQYASGLRDVTVLPTGERSRPGRTRGDQRDATGIMQHWPRCLLPDTDQLPYVWAVSGIYDSPWALPFLRRNEIAMPVDGIGNRPMN